MPTSTDTSTPVEETASTILKTVVAGDTFIAETSDQGQIRIRLRFKTKVLRQVAAADPVDQLFELLDAVGDTGTSEKIDELDIFDTYRLVSVYFAAFEEKQQAALGESKRSSN